MIKCVYWGGPVSQDNAVNTGQTRGSFSVVIAGSNGYVTNQIKTPAGYQAGTPYGKYAINAPYDAQGYNTFMGSKIFTSTWDVASCSAYCDSQTAYNKATAPKDGTPYKVCNFFNTYVLTAYKADGTVQPQGQYCALYTEAWTSTYATNAGQWRGQDQYLVNYSFGYPKSSPGVSPTVGDVKGAAYQALADIKWSSLQPFCSTLLGYTVPVSSVTALTTTTPIVTSTVYSSTTILKRAAQTTPAGLAKYQAPVLSSACSMAVTSPTITSTVTAATSTVVAVAQTSTVTAVTTITAPKPGSCSNGGVCGSFVVKYDSADRVYTCGLDVTGAAVCVYDNTCEAQQCSSNSGCASGETCWAQGCCGYAICSSITNECANSNSAKFLFNRRNTNVARDSSECTGMSCPEKAPESQII